MSEASCWRKCPNTSKIGPQKAAFLYGKDILDIILGPNQLSGPGLFGTHSYSSVLYMVRVVENMEIMFVMGFGQFVWTVLMALKKEKIWVKG